jgi:two-component system, OmpR family, sensor kinase
MGFGDAFRGGLWQSLARRLYGLAIASVLLGIVTTFVVVRVIGEPPAPGQRMLPLILAPVAERIDDLPAARASLEKLRAMSDLEFTIYDENDVLLLSTIDPPHSPLPASLKAALKSPHDVRFHREIRAVVTRLTAPDGRTLWAIGDMGPPPLGQQFLVLGIALTILLGLLAVVFTSFMARPLGELAKSAELFGEGDLLARADPKKAGAFDGLANTFNEMADRITASMNAEKELLANVSHELRTPLSRIRVALDLAEEGDADLARESLKDITEDLAELEKIIDDVLTAARFDKRMQGAVPKLHLEDVPVALLIDKAVARFKASHPGHVLDVDNTSSATIHADPTLLRRALDNLLDNAAKYSDEASLVKLEVVDVPRSAEAASIPRSAGAASIPRSAGAASPAIRISIIDHGVGMTPEELAHLFTPFFRAEKSRARKKGGVGLGMVLSRRIVDAHGGTVDVKSEPSKGTTVTLIIPTRSA